MEWRVLKANADTEREHLNKILAEIAAATGGTSVTGDLVQGSGITLTGTLTDRLTGAGNVTIAATSSDPWTYVSLGSDFSTTSTGGVVTGMSFTPAINSTYEVEALMLITTTSTTVGARPGVDYANGTSYGAAMITAPNSATAFATLNSTAPTSATVAATGLPATGTEYLATMKCLFVTGASITTDFQLLLGTETAGTSVSMRTGSFIKYRTI